MFTKGNYLPQKNEKNFSKAIVPNKIKVLIEM